MSSLKETNPMRSTWRTADRNTWSFGHWFLETFQAHPTSLGQHIPKHGKKDKVPYMSQWTVNCWVLVYASIPLLLQSLSTRYLGRNLGHFEALGLYSLAFSLTLLRQIHILRRLGHIHGFFDGDEYARNQVPDSGVSRVVFSLFKTTGLRIGASVLLAYKPDKAPFHFSWLWLPLQIGLYGIILDFFFYWYHRATHEIDALWHTHRLHHYAKHPNAIMTAYADESENILTMCGIPTATFLTLRALHVPMDFYSWWICHAYVTFTEVISHSGVRVHMSTPSTVTWLLQFFDTDMVIEDHDLHHQRGWKKSYNYGKQTMVWDSLFGTRRERVEGLKGKVDYKQTAAMPVF